MNMQNLPDSDQRSSSEIQSGIRDTRQRMDATLDELGQRLTPRSLLNSAMDWWDENSAGATGKSRVQKTYHLVSHQVKKHPAPSLLIGAGLAWLFLNSDDDDETAPSTAPATPRSKVSQPAGDDQEPSTFDRIADKVGDAKEAVSGAFDSVKNKTDELLEGAADVGGKAQELYTSGKQTVKTKVHGGVEQLRDAMDDYPLAMGAAFLALGALAGVILPPTRREDSLLGSKSDDIVSEIKAKGEELLEQGKEKASEVGDELLAKARDQGITAETVGEKLTELTASAGEAVRNAAVAVATSLHDEQLGEKDPASGIKNGI